MGELGKLVPLGLREGLAQSEHPPVVSWALQRSTELGVPIEYLGIERYDSRIRVYQSEGRDWVLAPLRLDPLYVDAGGQLPIPRLNLDQLRRLVEGGVDFASIFIGHDIPEGSAREIQESQAPAANALARRSAARVITQADARRLVAPVPPPARTLEWSRRYGTACDLMLKWLAGASIAAVGIAVAPLTVIAPMFSAFGSAEFEDPVLFGAIPLSDTPSEGSPAAWFALTSWTY